MPDLCTLSYVKSLLGSETAAQTQNDPIYASLISAASAAFLTLTNRACILATQFTETRDGDESESLILRNTPILSVQSLSVGRSGWLASAGVPVSPYTGAGPGFLIADNGFALEMIGSFFFRGRRNVSITYTAGFATVPLDIQQAVAEMVLWKKAKMPRIDTSSHSLAPGETISFSGADFPPSAKTVIEQYKTYGGFRSR